MSELTAPAGGTKAIAVLTSGGDAQGMNAVVRAVVRTAINAGAEVYVVYEGLQGLVDGGERIVKCDWSSVGGILHKGGTVIGTARSMDFRERWGRLKAAASLIERGIDRLVVVGGDGSLTGTDVFRSEWSELLAELAANGDITVEQEQRHAHLIIAGVVGSIDNDMVGTDMTVGADSALHRILEAIDAIASTAASHQRSFVVEVMGRHCGYLALMSAIAGGADHVLIPEMPPEAGWEDDVCDRLRAARTAGRRDSIVIVAEGARDREGNPITAQMVADAIAERTGEDVRITILGHVQRGGSPSAYDRWMPTLMGYAAALEVLSAGPDHVPQLIGVRNGEVATTALMEDVARTRQIASLIQAGRYDDAVSARGVSFSEMLHVFHDIARVAPEQAPKGLRIAVLHAGGLAPGMNAAVRAAVRFGISRGHTMVGVQNGFRGLLKNRVTALNWDDVEGWVSLGGAELGTSRLIPEPFQYANVSAMLALHGVEAVLVIGGQKGYQASYNLLQARDDYKGLQIPWMLLPASIDNNLPGWRTAIGADTALCAITDAVDRLKQSATASRRAFVIEVMGRYCGYLAQMGGLAAGAEQVFIPEQGISLAALDAAAQDMAAGFKGGRRIYLVVRNEMTSTGYTTEFLKQLFTEESEGDFDVRTMILGHLQQGGNPTPYDRVQATRLSAFAIQTLTEHAEAGSVEWSYIGSDRGRPHAENLRALPDVAENIAGGFRRPKQQWWLPLREVSEAVSQRS
ncbi:MAG: 6-phosphofructokinase 1 [Actinomycetota bacterium]|nr:6-phosphofructokinase 1 [Actinomycetota bacterium]